MSETKTVAQVLSEWMLANRMTVSGLAKELELERVFLTNLMRGDTPPRVRRDRKTADQDPRYEKLATRMGSPSFVQLVMEEQVRTRSRSPRINRAEKTVIAVVERGIGELQEIAFSGKQSADWREDMAKRLERIAAALRI